MRCRIGPGSLAGGLCLGFLALGCGSSKTTGPTLGRLELVTVDSLGISEPSDLTIDDTGTRLWAVTNSAQGRASKAYELDLRGRRVKTLKYTGEDLEGIAYDASDTTLWVVEERRRDLVHLDLKGNVLSTVHLDLSGEANHGPEGVCLDDHGRKYLVNEKRPALYLELNSDLSIGTQLPLSFASDYSAISFNRRKSAFWLVSDESRGLYLWSRSAGLIGAYLLPLPKFEGVAVDDAAQLVYMVNDSTNSLYVYRQPPQ